MNTEVPPQAQLASSVLPSSAARKSVLLRCNIMFADAFEYGNLQEVHDEKVCIVTFIYLFFCLLLFVENGTIDSLDIDKNIIFCHLSCSLL